MMSATKLPVIFAHRGASGYYPENTMIAFTKAVELGATGIETDVQMTQDGRLVLIHDESLQRTAGSPRLVKDTSFDELRSLDAGSWFNPSFREERIPALEQLLELAAATDGLVLNVELKNGIIPYSDIEQKTIEAIRQYGLADRCIISSFNHYSLVVCKQLAPDIQTGALYMEGLYRPWDYAALLGADALHPFKYAVTPEWVQEAAERGIRYHPFTVNDTEEMERMLQCGIAGIITDYPDRLKQLLEIRAEDGSSRSPS